MRELVLREQAGPVLVLTLNRPERHNSLIPELLQQLLDALAETAARRDIRSVVLQANGRSFSTGGDAKEFVARVDDIEAYSRHLVGLLNQVILAMIEVPVPIVTAVHGVLTGGALGFVLGSDIVIVARGTCFAPYYSDVGPSPDGGWATLLPLIIGRKRAAEVLYGNHEISAEDAVAWGLANRLVPAALVREEALALAQEIATKKPGSVRHTKRLLYWDRDRIAAGLESELKNFLEHVVTEEAIAGFRDFVRYMRSRQ